jgi:hypothetical protein
MRRAIFAPSPRFRKIGKGERGAKRLKKGKIFLDIFTKM